MSRERTTWNREQIVKLANSLKKADDPRAMNQDHLSQQPAADKYEIGGPSEFAEDVAPNNWKAEYSGGEVKRNEIGLPELRSETFNHSEKTAGQQQDESEDDDFLEKKADVCLNLARKMLPKTASEQMVEDQAFAFMHMADADIVATAARLASQDEEDKKQSQQGQQQSKGQQEAKEAGQIPENFKKDEDKKDEGQQAKEAGQIPENFKKDEDKKDEGQQAKEAQGQQQKSDEDKKQSQQGQQDEQQKKEAALNDLRKRACDALQQGNPQLAQELVQQMAQQQAPAQQQQQMMSQEQAQQQIDQMLAQAQQGQQGQQIMATDAELLDRMLAEPTVASTDTAMLTAGTGPSMDIQLEGPSMDMSEVRLGSEDEALTALFASHDEVQQAAHAHSLSTGIPVQASAPMTRTASTRTVGTRPTGGVSQLGGASAPSTGGEIDKLAGLWASAPNVKSVFDT